ncbi:MAG: hypothetical protein CBARDMAM_5085 [uncultured Caballeronia sp.]|nr:MAG: hypothetical protein CBARDMAM_5085 [uncultured Caballeronia sp.]
MLRKMLRHMVIHFAVLPEARAARHPLPGENVPEVDSGACTQPLSDSPAILALQKSQHTNPPQKEKSP